MERGQFDVFPHPVSVFVFDNVIGHCNALKRHKQLIYLQRWKNALDCWSFDSRVCSFMTMLRADHQIPIEVVTWQPSSFAEQLQERFDRERVYVRDVYSLTYEDASAKFSLDKNIDTVYDPFHAPYGYGWKARKLTLGVI